MRLQALKIQNCESELLKLVILLLAGLPIVSYLPVNWLGNILFADAGSALNTVLAQAAMTLLLWLFCWFNSGTSKMLGFLASAFFLGLTTVLLGAVLRKLFLLEHIGENAAESFRLLRLFYNILMVVPFSLLFINAFSARKIISAALKMPGYWREPALHLALSLRIFQHAGEVVQRLLQIWKEEHPALVFPRFDRDLRGWASIRSYYRWVRESIRMWIFACIILTFEPIPVMVQEIEQIYLAGEINDGKKMDLC